MTNNEINVTATCIAALANEPNSEDKIKLLLTSLFQSYSKEGFLDEPEKKESFSSVSAPLVFTQKEIDKMPKKFSKEFKVRKLTAHVRQRNTGVYEVYCYVNGIQLWATSKTLATAKSKFIAKLDDVAKGKLKAKPSKTKGTNFTSYMLSWLETVKKPFIKEVSYVNYYNAFKHYIEPALKGKALEELKPIDIQTFLNTYLDLGKNRTAKKLYQLLSQLFDYAVIDGLIVISPMKKVTLPHYEQEHGVPFTRVEEALLVKNLKENPHIYRQAFVFMIYTGLRRAELSTVKIENDWIHIITAKQRKGYKEKIRSMPMPPMLKALMPLINVDEIKKLTPHILTKHLKLQFDNHHLHDLRHTFITRAQECGIRREYASMWAGHKADTSITSNVYTHLEQNKDVQIEEMKKFQYKL